MSHKYQTFKVKNEEGFEKNIETYIFKVCIKIKVDLNKFNIQNL